MDTQPIRLVRASTREPVDALLHWQVAADRVIAAETSWAPFRSQAGEDAEHAHWDWRLKVGLLTRPGYRCLGVECDGDMQGMAIVCDTGKRARLEPDRGQPLVYIDFLESAPWNNPEIVPDPRLRGAGQRLIWAAIRLSRERGYHCRVGLHSLPQSESYYEQTCRFTAVGQDPRYNGLMYYEFTAADAAEFLRRLGDD